MDSASATNELRIYEQFRCIPELDPENESDLEVISALKGTGFEYFLQLPKKLSHFKSVARQVVQCFEVSDFGFNVKVAKLHISLMDVLYITGLPIHGRPITGVQGKGTEAVRNCFGDLKNYLKAASSLQLSMLKELAENRGEEVEKRVRAVALVVIGRFISPSSSNGTVSTHFCSFVENVADIGSYAWGEAMLVKLLHCIFKFKAESQPKGVSGSILLATIFFFHLIKKLPEAIGIKVPDDNFPLMINWCRSMDALCRNAYNNVTDEKISQVMNNLEYEDVNWQAYKILPRNFNNLNLRLQQRMCLTVKPMILRKVCLWHQPHLSQHIELNQETREKMHSLVPKSQKKQYITRKRLSGQGTKDYNKIWDEQIKLRQATNAQPWLEALEQQEDTATMSSPVPSVKLVQEVTPPPKPKKRKRTNPVPTLPVPLDVIVIEDDTDICQTQSPVPATEEEPAAAVKDKTAVPSNLAQNQQSKGAESEDLMKQHRSVTQENGAESEEVKQQDQTVPQENGDESQEYNEKMKQNHPGTSDFDDDHYIHQGRLNVILPEKRQQLDDSISGEKKDGDKPVDVENEEIKSKNIAATIEVFELSDDDDDTNYSNQQGKPHITVEIESNDSDEEDDLDSPIWNLQSPCGIKREHLPMTLLKVFSDTCPPDVKFNVWKNGQKPEETVPLVDAIRQHFPQKGNKK